MKMIFLTLLNGGYIPRMFCVLHFLYVYVNVPAASTIVANDKSTAGASGTGWMPSARHSIAESMLSS